MPGYSTPVSSGLSGTTVLTDNTDPASLIEIELPDGKDLLEFDTSDNAVKLTMLGGFTHSTNESSGLVGIRETAPKAPLHIVGTGGSTGMSVDPTVNHSATVFVENSNNNSKDRCLMILNGDGGSGSAIDFYHTDQRRLGLAGFGSAASIFTDNGVPLQISAVSGQYMNFTTGGVERLRIHNDGKLTTGAEDTGLCAASGGVHIRTGTGSTLSSAHASADDLVVEGATHCGMTFITGGTTNNTYIQFADNDSNGAGGIYYGHGNNRLELNAGGTWIATFTNTGQVNGAEMTAGYLFHAQDGEIGIQANSADAVAQSLVFAKSRHATNGSHTIVADDDVLGEIEFKGSDGNSWALASRIYSRVDGTPGDGDMPGAIVFATTADGAEATTDRMTINAAGQVLIGSPSTARTLAVAGEFRVEADGVNDFFQVTNMSGAGSAGINGISQGDINFKLKSSNAYFGVLNDSGTLFSVNQNGKISSGGEAGTTALCDAGGLHLLGSAATSNSGVNAGSRLLVLEDNGSDGAGMTIICDDANQGKIDFADDTAIDGWVRYHHSGVRALRLGAGGSEQVRVYSSGLIVNGGIEPAHRVHVQDGDLGIVTNSADAVGKSLIFTKSRNATDGSATVVQDDDVLGNIEFHGAEDGDSWAAGAKIFARVNGTPGDGDMPTELVFATSADGSETPSERLAILSTGVAKFAGDVEVEKSAPKLTMDNSAAGDNYGDRSSTIQWEGVATRDSGTATTLGSVRFQHLGSGTGNRAEFVVAVNNAGDSGTTDTLNDRLRILGDSGTMKLSGVFQTGDGNASSPSHGFTSSTNTGMFHDGSNGLAFSAAGTERFRCAANGTLSTGNETSPLGGEAGSLHIRTADSGGNVESVADDLIIERAGGPGMVLLQNSGDNTSSTIAFRRGTSNTFLVQSSYVDSSDIQYRVREMTGNADATIRFIPVGATVAAGQDVPVLTLGGGTKSAALVSGNASRALSNTGSSNNHGSSPRVIDCTAHGLKVGEAVVLLSGNSGNTNKETFTITAESTNQFTVDSDPTHETSNKTVKADPEKTLQVINVDGKELFCVGRSTNLIWHDGQVASIGGTQTVALVTEHYGNDIPGSKNTLIGARAAKGSNSGSMTVIGCEAGEGGAGTEAVIVGYYAGNAGPGNQTTLVGSRAGSSLQSGAHYNVCLGHQAGNALTTGDDNTMLGENCDGAATASNQIAIGHDAVSTMANETVIGDAMMATLRPMSQGQFSIGRAGFEVSGMLGYGGGVLMGRAAAISSINQDQKILAQVFANSQTQLVIPANSYVTRMGITSTSNADSNAYSVTLNTGTVSGETALGALTNSVERIGAGVANSRTSASTGSAADLAVAATGSHTKVVGITTEGFWTGANDLFVYVMTAGTGNANTASGLNFKFGVFVEYVGMGT